MVLHFVSMYGAPISLILHQRVENVSYSWTIYIGWYEQAFIGFPVALRLHFYVGVRRYGNYV